MTSPFGTLSCRDLLTIEQLSPDDVQTIFRTAATLKADRFGHGALLANRRLAMVFEKDSLRTRFTFDIGMQDLGGKAVFMDHRDARIGARESLKDVGRNLERWVHGVVARTYKQWTIEELANHSDIPVINGLSDSLHPCQGLTDWFTLVEHWGNAYGKGVCYIGDGNNTCHSLMQVGARLGAKVTVCTPLGYEPDGEVLRCSRAAAAASGGSITVLHDPAEAVAGAHAVYTDTWASMGQEDEIEERNRVFEPYRVDEALMEQADPDAWFLHCLPAHRGQEVSSAVLDGPRSIVYDNAENRLHVQKALLALLMG